MPAVLITGANRGIGLEFARQYAGDGWWVIACARDPDQAEELRAVGGTVDVHRLDVTDHAAVDRLAASLDGVAIDLLLNNAGVIGREAQSLGALDYGAWLDTLRVNLLGPVKMAEAFADHVAASEMKRIVSISSRMGAIGEAGGGYYAYRTSKAALNMAVKALAADLRGRGITAVVFHPGHVRTRMGGGGAPLPPDRSVANMRRVIAGLQLSDSGRFFNQDGTPIAW